MMSTEKIVVYNQDRSSPTGASHPIVIVLDRLRSAFNVGNIIRIADVIAAEKIITCGYTASPPHPKITKTALGAEEFVTVEHYEESLSAVRELQDLGYQVIGIETVKDAPSVWDLTITFPVAFVFGNEALGVDKSTLKQCNLIARLPAFGRKNSLNVANCAAVVLYRAVEQYSQHPGE